MMHARQKTLQYLKEARASELALVRVLQSQIAMAPRGSLRTSLEQHLEETRGHARLLQERIGELRKGFDPVGFAFGVAEIVVGQALALGKTPLDLVRGTGREEQVLKNAKDAAATEALEIATYTALERIAERAGDRKTATLAATIRREEEQMLDRLLTEIPGLADAVFAADVEGASTHGAAEAEADAAAATKADRVPKATADDAPATKTDAAPATKTDAAPVTKADRAPEATADDAPATKADSAPGTKAGDASDAAADDAPETKAAENDDAEKPWAGYDELSVEEVRAVLLTADAETAEAVVAYETANQARADVLEDAGRKVPSS